MMSTYEETSTIRVDLIDVPEGRRVPRKEDVERLAESIDSLGLQTPITCRIINEGERIELIAGAHRLAAVKRLGWPEIKTILRECTDVEAEMWEIAENLHRADLRALERSEQTTRWVRLLKLAQGEQVSGGRGKRGGDSLASEELGISRGAIQKASKVASLADEAKEMARECGLDDNQSALLEAVKEPTPEAQVHYLRERSGKPAKHADDPLNDFEAEERQVAALMVAWNKAGVTAREKFLARIDKPVMGKQWA